MLEHTHTHTRDPFLSYLPDALTFKRYKNTFRRKIISIILFSVLISFEGFAASDPCACFSLTTIGSNGTTTNDPSLSPNTCYLIRGTVKINNSTSWDNLILKMEEGSQILVSSSLSITNSYISGCDKMWKGIKTDSYTTLSVFKNTIIESAEFGISLSNGTTFTCRDNQFINNYIGIAVGNPFSLDDVKRRIKLAVPITGCKFYTNTVVPNPYSGHSHYTTWPTSPTGIPFNQGFAGIFLSKSSKLNIGVVGALTTTRNKFYQLRNGIVIRKSTCNIYGSDFYDLEGSVPRYLGDPILDLNQYGINFNGGYGLIKDNTFENLMRGIYFERLYGEIHDNNFNIPSGGFLVAPTRGIAGKHPDGLEITFNTIYDGFKGIEVIEGYLGYLTVSDNILYREMTAYRNTGIEINNCRYPMYGAGKVEDNVITIDDATSSLGISMLSSTNFLVNSNEIYYTSASEVGDDNIGVSVLDGGQSTYSHNVVDATSEYISDQNNSGILTKSQDNIFFCNSMDNFSSLFKIIGPNTNTILATNYFVDANIGLELVAPAMIGSQIHSENKWIGTYSTKGAFISGPLDLVSATAAASRFRVDQTTSGNLPTYGPTPQADGWFVSASGTGIECEIPVPIIEYEEDSLVKLVIHEFDFDDYSTHMEWQVKANIFEIILNNPDLKTNPILDSFFTAEEFTVLGELVKAQHGLSYRLNENEIEIRETEERIASLSEDMDAISNNLYGIWPLSYSPWFNLLVLKGDTLHDQLISWIDLIEDEDLTNMSNYGDIKSNLERLTTGNDLEAFLTQALIFRAQYFFFF